MLCLPHHNTYGVSDMCGGDVQSKIGNGMACWCECSVCLLCCVVGRMQKKKGVNTFFGWMGEWDKEPKGYEEEKKKRAYASLGWWWDDIIITDRT